MSNRRARGRRNVWLASGAIVLSILLLILALGFYPLAIVNGRVIWASTFRSYLASALSYQQAAAETYTTSSQPLVVASTHGEAVLGAAALDELVEQHLIQDGLERLVGDSAPQLSQNKLNDLLKEPDLPGAARALFQLDPNAFVAAILYPQAEREVLAGRVYLEGKTLDEWVLQARKEARVRLLTSSYRWDGEHVQAK